MFDFLKNKKTIYGITAIILLIIIAIVLTIKPWVKKPVKVVATQLGEMNILDSVISADNQDILYYDLDKLNLYKYNLKTKQQTQISNNFAFVPEDLIWSPDRSQVIVKIVNDKTKFQDQKSVFFNSNVEDNATMLWNYNLSTKKLALLNSEINNSIGASPHNPIWTTDSQKIIYSYADQNQTASLYTANPDGSGQQKIGDVPTDLYSIYIYDSKNKTVYYSTTIDQETETGQIYQYNLSTSKKAKIGINSNFGLAIDDHRFIYSDNENTKLYDITSNGQKTLPISLDTWRVAVSSNKNNLVVAIWNKDVGAYYIENINLQDFSVKKILNLDKGDAANYTNLNIDSNGNIFFVNNKNLFEIKN